MQYLTEYRNLINTISKFMKDPIVFIKEKSEEDHPLSEELKKLVPNLEGEFTKGKAIDQARKLFKKHFDETSEKLKNEATKFSIVHFVDETIKQLEELLNEVYKNMDFIVLNDRKNRIGVNHLAIQYAYTNISRILDVKTKDFQKQYNARQFLFALRELMSAIRTHNIQQSPDYINIASKIEEFKMKIGAIWAITENPDAIEDLAKYSEIPNTTESYNHEKSGKEVFESLLEQMEVLDNPEKTDEMKEVVDYLINIMDGLERTYLNVKQNMNSIKEYFKKLKGDLVITDTTKDENTNLIEVIIDKTIAEAINPYLDAKITSSEFNKSIRDNLMLMEASTSHMMRIKDIIVNTIMLYRGHILAYEYTYTLIDEVSLNSMMPNKSLVI